MRLGAVTAKLTPFHGPTEVECRHCLGPLTATRFTQHYCSTRCRSAALNARDRGDRPGRGAGRKFPRVRYAARRAIFERDGWICQLCGAPVDPELTNPHPGSASIDHRDPGGPHDPTNWQTAHLACNVSKGRKVAIGASPKLKRAAA
jgi:5-methylcytosine-specific restriction endonuclease McrA